MADKKWFEGALHMVNRDPNWYGYIDGESKEKCIESIKAHFDRFAGSDVTDVMLGLLESTTIVPSNSYMWRGLKYVQKIENGIEVDYTENKGIKGKFFTFKVDNGTDLYGSTGLLIKADENTYYTYASKTATISFKNGEIKSASEGVYKNGEWVKTKDVEIVDGVMTYEAGKAYQFII